MAPRGFYKSTLDCFKKTLKWEGVKGFYSGIWSPLAGQMFFRATSFATFHNTALLLQRMSGNIPSGFGSLNELETVAYVDNVRTANTLLVAGAVTGFAISFVEVR